MTSYIKPFSLYFECDRKWSHCDCMVGGEGIGKEYLQWPGLNMKGSKDVGLVIWGMYPTLWWCCREDDAMSDKCKPKRFTESVAPIWKDRTWL